MEDINKDKELTVEELDKITAGVPNTTNQNNNQPNFDSSKSSKELLDDLDDFDFLVGAERLFNDIEKSGGRHR